jgi:hypothetical protein
MQLIAKAGEELRHVPNQAPAGQTPQLPIELYVCERRV